MKLLKTSFKALLLSLFILGAAAGANAQDKRAAIKSYNKALEMVKGEKYEQAVNLFNQAIDQASKLGKEGNDIKQRAEKKLPEVYYQVALQRYRAFQKDQSVENLDATISAFNETTDISKEYGNSQLADRSTNVITQLMYQKSILQYKQKQMEDALATLDQVIKRNPNYAKAYYQKGIVIKNMDSKTLDEAIAMFDKAIEVGNKTGDSEIVSKAKESVHDELVYRGSKATDNKNFSEAVNLLTKALKYEPESASANYRLAAAYNKTQDWQKAVDHSQQALKYETGGKTEKAKIYFELATAYQGQGQKEKACTAYENAAYGSFKSPAEHQMEYELKCESTTN